MKLSEIAAVDVVAPEGEDLWGFHLDAPQAAATHDAYAFDVRGWVLGRRERVTSVELMHGSRLLWRVPVDIEREEVSQEFPQADGGATGFFTIVNSLNLPPEFEILLRARLADASRVPLARLRGRREPLRTVFEPQIDPLLVTTLGRTGSTILMKVLAAHPEVVACSPFQHEARVATYWMGVMKSLTDPVSYRRQINPTGTIDGTWWIGDTPPLPRRPKDPHLARWLDVDAVRDIAAFCQSRIEAAYTEVAADAAGTPRYFAEKYRPDRISAMMSELYPRAREIVLVRDFRDMVASMFAYNVKRGRMGFRRDKFDDDAQYVIRQIKPSVAALTEAWKARSDSAHLVRYEDLVLDPEPTIAALLGHLGLPADGHAAAMAAALTARDPETEWHRTTPDPAASIGRWQRDLDEGVRLACEEALAPELQAFGYPLEKAPV